MSSMLKKAGGLSFKPKAGRRPGTGAANPPAPVASTSTTRAPTTEPQSQASTPAGPSPSTPAAIDSIETGIHEPGKPPILAKQLPKTASLQTPSASVSEPRIDIPTVQPTPELAISPPRPPSLPILQIPTPQSSNDNVRDPSPLRKPHAPTAELLSQDEEPTPSVERENSPPDTSNTPSQIPAALAPPTATPETSSSKEAAVGPLTAPPSPPPVSDTISAEPSLDEAAASQVPVPKRRAPRKRKSTVTESGTDVDGAAPKKKRQPRKPSTRKTAEASEGANTKGQKTTRRRRREPTPENAEELTVDHSTMTVGELTKDLGIGKRFRHAEEIEQRAREARAKYRLKRLEREKRKLGLLPPDEDDTASQPDTLADGSETRGAAIAQLGASMESGGGQGVGYDVVDGQIVVHAASLVVDRHNRDMQNYEEVEENDFTNLVNAASFAKRVQAPGNWTDDETEKFYRLLGMFGTDFETISRLFPSKNRRAIKLKFNKEERLRPNRVNAAMMVRGQKKVNIDIEEYKATQRQWQDKEKILEEHARLVEEHEREVSRLREERRAAGLIDDDDNNNRKKDMTNGNGNHNGRGNGDFEVIEEDADLLGQGGQEDMEVDTDAQPEGVQA